MDITVVVPTYNERPNVAELVSRLEGALAGRAAEVIFVDDSTDTTVDEIERVAADAALPVRLIHRERPRGGLGGAVVEGIRAARADQCVVMDADLQHPPEVIPALLAAAGDGVDVVVASRYAGGGTARGLSGRLRVGVSRAATLVTKAMFPIRLHACSDPMTGFFLLDRRSVDWMAVQPRGFKILLEILARQNLRTVEVPFSFADRYAGRSKASARQGMRFMIQLAYLRFGKMSLFAVVGALGAVANLLIMAGLTAAGVGYIWAAVVAAEVTIIGNFVLIERFVFREMREQASGVGARFAKSFSFNNAEALLRIPLIAFLVESWHVSSILAAAATLFAAFIVRFVFHALVVYAPRSSGGRRSRGRRVAEAIDAEAVRPGEL
ncbi:glycosyltransferase family 2 protein [Microbacterium sp. LRZ72]|uniref:glycosyltransferase family 2 protein n=1 Tax=Microbacterium sp. LRZ72 TaxID=2942481 RepID=UPI0029AE14A9|nr:glycosyltransferase family 2 protein [Microbacterium sp. LRZ72]MDX2377456.1 glycosyltransferase family 2 protein [Microbacterium sp. LRZ72]